MYILVLLTGVRVVWSDSCCGSADCAQSCPWNNACGDGTNHQCMDRISGPFKCRDDSKCHNYDDCTEYDAMLRAGHVCNGFPFYAGGYPLDDIIADSEKETYGCTATTNDEYCSAWWTLEDSRDQFEIGEAVCDAPSNNGKYCAEWTVEQEEYQKCWLESYYDEEEGRYRNREVCCSDYPYEHCCQEICDPSFYNAHHSEHETTECECRVESFSGTYCAEWYCEEYGNYNPGQTWYQGREKESYTCINNGPSDTYCRDWYGDIDGYEEFEVSKCRCDKEAENHTHCELWSCDEIGFDYYWPNLLWCLFSGIMGIPITIFGLCMIPRYAREVSTAKFDEIFCTLCLVNILWAGGFIMIGVWKAGFMVFVFTFPIHILPLVVYAVVRSKKENSSKTVSPKSNVEDLEMELPPKSIVPPKYEEVSRLEQQYNEHAVVPQAIPQAVEALNYESAQSFVPSYYQATPQVQTVSVNSVMYVPVPYSAIPMAPVMSSETVLHGELRRLKYLRETNQISEQAYQIDVNECLKRL